MNSTLPGMEKPTRSRSAGAQQGLVVRARGRDAAGSRLRAALDAKELALLDEANGVEFFYLRPRDIAVYVGEGTLDVGITGRDMLLDSRAHATEVLPLGFGRSRFRFAAPLGSEDVGGAAARPAAGDVVPGTGRVLSG